MSTGSPRQGGDLRGRGPVSLDLSTCVNPYGPPDTVMETLRSLPPDAIRTHPYQAAGDVEASYAAYLGQPAGQLVAGRGTSDLIWTLARHLDGKTTGLPLPAYTEFRQAFPLARTFRGGPSTHPLDVLDTAMQACDAVIISNPHNPTGQVLQRGDLADIARRHPACILVADESYMDFLPGHAAMTLTGCDLGNVIVLRSPSKFFGLAGARSGVAWSQYPPRARWRDQRTSWPVSAFAATALKTALADTSWAVTARQSLAGDVRWLERAIAGSGLRITPGRLHFRLLTGSAADVTRFAASLESRGIAVRVLEEAYGAGTPAVRITSPRRQDRHKLAAALGQHSERTERSHRGQAAQ
jgi:histidinol-phosphate/aromatic aminotransferase/cobyric acid decarboxylase-like protein